MRQRHLKIGILLLIFSTLTAVTQAQGRLYVHNIDGKQQSYVLNGIRKLTFPVENMVITFNSVSSKSYALADIQYCNFRFIPGWHQIVGPGIVISIYPNPTDDKLIIECSEDISKIILSDIVGRRVMLVLPKTTSTILQLGNFSSGVYILQIFTNSGMIVKEIIKN